MIWIDSIDLLDYYSPTTVDVECYCETILEPGDIFLQAPIGTISGSYSTVIQVLTPDGLTLLETIDNTGNIYYDVNYVSDSSGNYYADIRFKRFSPAMCQNPCFILRVTIVLSIQKPTYTSKKTIFDKYTQRYCLDSCCLIPQGITVQTGQDGEGGEYDEQDYGNEYYNVS